MEYVVNQICKKVCEWIEKRKKITVKPTYVKENLSVFILSVIENPSFDSQTKETLTTTSANFGSKCVVTDKFIEQSHKSDIIERIIELHEFKEASLLKKRTVAKLAVLGGS